MWRAWPMPSAKIVAQKPAGSVRPLSLLGQPLSAAAELARYRRGVQAHCAPLTRSKAPATQKASIRFPRKRLMFPPKSTHSRCFAPQRVQIPVGALLRLEILSLKSSTRHQPAKTGSRLDSSSVQPQAKRSSKRSAKASQHVSLPRASKFSNRYSKTTTTHSRLGDRPQESSLRTALRNKACG